MKRRAYTLAEVLIALGIVGILAAIMVPLVNKFKPDTAKSLYLKTYDALALSVDQMANNETFYLEDDGNYNYSKYPFLNLRGFRFNDGTQVAGGRNKFCRVLSTNLNIMEDVQNIISNTPINGVIACQDAYKKYENAGDFQKAFTATNGVEFMVSTNGPASSNAGDYAAPVHYQTDITIDLNGAAEGPNCVYSEACKNPDRFIFQVSASGELRAADEMGIFYLETRTNLKYKDKDDVTDQRLLDDIRERVDQADEEPFFDEAITVDPSTPEEPEEPGTPEEPGHSWQIDPGLKVDPDDLKFDPPELPGNQGEKCTPRADLAQDPSERAGSDGITNSKNDQIYHPIHDPGSKYNQQGPVEKEKYCIE